MGHQCNQARGQHLFAWVVYLAILALPLRILAKEQVRWPYRTVVILTGTHTELAQSVLRSALGADNISYDLAASNSLPRLPSAKLRKRLLDYSRRSHADVSVLVQIEKDRAGARVWLYALRFQNDTGMVVLDERLLLPKKRKSNTHTTELDIDPLVRALQQWSAQLRPLDSTPVGTPIEQPTPSTTIVAPTADEARSPSVSPPSHPSTTPEPQGTEVIPLTSDRSTHPPDIVASRVPTPHLILEPLVKVMARRFDYNKKHTPTLSELSVQKMTLWGVDVQLFPFPQPLDGLGMHASYQRSRAERIALPNDASRFSAFFEHAAGSLRGRESLGPLTINLDVGYGRERFFPESTGDVSTSIVLPKVDYRYLFTNLDIHWALGALVLSTGGGYRRVLSAGYLGKKIFPADKVQAFDAQVGAHFALTSFLQIHVAAHYAHFAHVLHPTAQAKFVAQAATDRYQSLQVGIAGVL